MACPDNISLAEYYANGQYCAYGHYDEDAMVEYPNAGSYPTQNGQRNRRFHKNQRKPRNKKTRFKRQNLTLGSENSYFIGSTWSIPPAHQMYPPSSRDYAPVEVLTFSGGPSARFFYLIERYFEQNNTPDDEKLKIALMALDGLAWEWFMCVKSDGLITDFPAFKEQLTAVFPLTYEPLQVEEEIPPKFENQPSILEFKNSESSSPISQIECKIDNCTISHKTANFDHFQSSNINYVHKILPATPIMVEVKNSQVESSEISQIIHRCNFTTNGYRSSISSWICSPVFFGAGCTNCANIPSSMPLLKVTNSSGISRSLKVSRGSVTTRAVGTKNSGVVHGEFFTKESGGVVRAVYTKSVVSYTNSSVSSSEVSSKFVSSCKTSSKLMFARTAGIVSTRAVSPEVSSTTTYKPSSFWIHSQAPEASWSALDTFKMRPLLQYKYRRKRNSPVIWFYLIF